MYRNTNLPWEKRSILLSTPNGNDVRLDNFQGLWMQPDDLESGQKASKRGCDGVRHHWDGVNSNEKNREKKEEKADDEMHTPPWGGSAFYEVSVKFIATLSPGEVSVSADWMRIGDVFPAPEGQG
ncbi:hypothetical protein HNY73_015782 [Argiope bruennichi]|uniref:Uncharacterized protein n=1 Tax=Argiope bruennichi TaxID=94029 RepID=A0A8T0ELK2_ARGBR|nr:hypothetical protein HNY73_015782 [Argiope bruennichi]